MVAALSRLFGGTMCSYITLGTCVFLASCGNSQGPKRLLQFQFFPKDAFVMYLSNDSEIFLRDGPPNFGGRSDLVYRFDVISIDPDGVVEFKIDVKKAKFPALLAPLGPALGGQSFQARMSPDGEFLSFAGTEEMRQRVLDSIVFTWGTRTDEQSATAKANLIKYITDEALRGVFEPLFRVWPSTPVAPGDTWARESIPSYLSPLPVVYETSTFEVSSWETGEVTIASEGNFVVRNSAASDDLGGSSRSTIKIDPIEGFIKSISLKREASGSFKSAGSAEPPVPIKITEDIFVELVQL